MSRNHKSSDSKIRRQSVDFRDLSKAHEDKFGPLRHLTARERLIKAGVLCFPETPRTLAIRENQKKEAEKRVRQLAAREFRERQEQENLRDARDVVREYERNNPLPPKDIFSYEKEERFRNRDSYTIDMGSRKRYRSS